MARLHPLRSFLIVLGVAFAAAVVASLLPENPYQRWQQLIGTEQGKTAWIYERIHFDPRPIDVAVVGPSRIDRGLDARHLETALQKQGVSARVVNFATPEGGRDVNDVIVEEMLTEKTPKLLIVGVIEKPSRFGHPAYKYLAPRSLLADPGYLTNANYLKGLVYLPFRQMRLFVAYLFPGAFDLKAKFDPATYEPDPQEGVLVKLKSGIWRPSSEAGPIEEITQGAAEMKARTHPPILPRAMADLEFGDDRHYVRRICAAAARKRVKVAFLFLPTYTGATTIQEEPLYRMCGPVWNAGFLASHAELYSDHAHLTTRGGDVMIEWIAPQVAHELARETLK